MSLTQTRSTLVGCLIALVALPSTTRGATYFLENFNSAQPNPNLTGYENFAFSNGAIQRNGSFSDVNDRRYMRTTASDYNNVDFLYELTFTTSVIPLTSLNFIGFGSGDRRPGASSGTTSRGRRSTFASMPRMSTVVSSELAKAP